METIDLCSNSDGHHFTDEVILEDVEFDWKEARALSDIGKQIQIKGDGNCGFRALLEGLKEKELIEETNEAGRQINVFDLHRRLHQFAKSHESTLINAEDSKVVGGMWRMNGPEDGMKNLKSILP